MPDEARYRLVGVMSIVRAALLGLLFGMSMLSESNDAILGQWNCTILEHTVVRTGVSIRTLEYKNVVLAFKSDKTASYSGVSAHWSSDGKKLIVQTKDLVTLSGEVNKQTLKMKGSEQGPEPETLIKTEWTCKRT